uniref:Uncharacterized protein n=1 Tax=Ananas comosus var. bracteatus TaxID=296719 RepID=A0A6V7P8E1_ANACO|nr:unnamed protein product [Ananas comosus var. bracteatus]
MRPLSSPLEILDTKEDGDEESGVNCGMGIEENENEVLEEEEIVFAPIEHPVEPPDDDRPAKCPMPESCPLTDEGELKESFKEILQKEAELLAEIEESADQRRSAKADRKRHHSGATGDPPKFPQLFGYGNSENCSDNIGARFGSGKSVSAIDRQNPNTRKSHVGPDSLKPKS